MFKNLLMRNFWPWIWIQHPKFSHIANFDIPKVCAFDFMVKMNVRIYKGPDCENRIGCNFTPSVIIHGQVPCKFSNLSSS